MAQETIKRDFSKTNPGEKQKITIIKHDNGSFAICHKHEALTFESYGAVSLRGVIRILENLLNGYQPNINDCYLRSPEKPPVHINGSMAPELLD
jgi:hypothetical protein